MTENAKGMVSPSKFPEKPDILKSYEYMNQFQLPLVQGSLIDQPYIAMLQMEIVGLEVQRQEEFRRVREEMRNQQREAELIQSLSHQRR